MRLNLLNHLAAVAALLAAASLAAAQDVKPVQSPVQAKLMAKRAAILDAQRQLLGIVEGVYIDSETRVKDFITERDEISSRVDGVIKGAEVVDTRYLTDGSCEVDMQLPVVRLAEALGRDLRYPGRVIRATGAGVPNPVEEKAKKPVEPKDQPWYTKTLSATGAGVPPAGKEGTAQGRRLAELAAAVDARRNLMEQVLGVEIVSKTTVRNFVTEDDKIEAKVKGFLIGSYPSQVRRQDDGSVEIEMSIGLRGLRSIIPAERGHYEIVE
jgi:hypothetical protein